MIRVFLAVELSSNIQEKLFALQQQLKRTLPSINWVRPESIHLTLKFLGYVEPSFVSPLFSALEPIGKHAPFSVDVQGLGVFPQVKHPRIFWVGLTRNTQVLQDLVCEIDVVLETMGFPPEAKAYHPHLTLARIKRENAKVGSALVQTGALEIDQNLGTLTIDRFTLFQSDLDSSGAKYTSLWTMPLSEIPSGS
jgi:RNA 2',3'-cyclic 3'-phosphodiesterase